MSKHIAGSVEAFDSNWRTRAETERYHFRRGDPENQVQFAFQNHWRVFQRVLRERCEGRALEVGCGRGSMGAFFANAGFETHLLDTSRTALQSALTNFDADALEAQVVCADVLSMPYANASFDVVVSIGLMEHFAEIGTPLREQLRVLRPGGVLLAYIVPERRISVQLLAAPVNAILRLLHAITAESLKSGAPAKQPLFRNTFRARDYLPILRAADVSDCGSFGMFPVPLVSHSWAFPFTAMSPPAERRLIKIWRALLSFRRTGEDAWVCREGWGLAFLVWAQK